MTQTKTGNAAASRKGAAARAEKSQKPKPKPFKFRKVELIGPAVLPGTLDFDLADLQLRAEEGDGGGAMRGMHRLLETVLGREELLKVRPVIKGLDDPWQQDLLGALLRSYGVDAGEA